MKLEAKARLLAAPVSVGERERFIKELMKMDHIFQEGELRDNAKTLFFKGKANGIKAILALTKLGWKKHAGSWSRCPGEEFPTYTRDGKWPINVHISPTGVSFEAPINDVVGDDTAFQIAMTRMVRAIMPGDVNLDLERGTAKWSKTGGYAGERIIKTVRQKALGLGFKRASPSYGAHPTGDWVSKDETFLHPEGWVLTTGATYGPTASSNSFRARLSVDYKRGEHK